MIYPMVLFPATLSYLNLDFRSRCNI